MPILLSAPLAYYYVRLVFLYYAYYDIGVNNYANSGWLTYFVMPWMFLLFNITGFGAQWLGRRRGMSRWRALGMSLVAMLALFVIAFLYTVVNNLDYPSPKSYNLFDFFGYLLGAK